MKSSARRTILLVDDDRLFRKAILNFLEEDYKVLEADSAEIALSMIREDIPDLVIVDITLPGMGGVDLLKAVQELHPEIPVIMLTAMDRIPRVVECIKLGAFDYLTKPVDAEELLVSVQRALESAQLKQEVEQRRRLQLMKNAEIQLIGSSEIIRKLREEVKVIGATDVTVLIEGETGVGKEVAARAIHAHSQRADRPFIAINCAAIPRELFESELFGHKKGAFTGADSDQPGKFRLAHGGTLFLDEVGEIPREVQSKLLRVLEEKTFYPLGSNTLVHVDVRIICATNADLNKLVEEGKFRRDLYFRLNVYTLKIPPLRERPEDILSLTKYFIKIYNLKFNKSVRSLTPEAKGLLLELPWRGNIRELRNTIERAVLFAKGNQISKEDLAFVEAHQPARQPTTVFELPEEGIDLEELEKSLIKQALEMAKYNKTRAARLLNISPPTLYYRLQKYGL